MTLPTPGLDLCGACGHKRRWHYAGPDDAECDYGDCECKLFVADKPAKATWLAHLDSCGDCNYDRECNACAADGEHAPEAHACNCKYNGKGLALRKAADDERATEKTAVQSLSYECLSCGRDISQEQFDKADSARGSHFRQCPKCGQFEARQAEGEAAISEPVVLSTVGKKPSLSAESAPANPDGSHGTPGTSSYVCRIPGCLCSGGVASVGEFSRNPPTTPPPETAEFYRQLFVAAYDAIQGTDGYGASFGDDPRVGYASGDKTPQPIANMADAERGRFGYDKPVTLASLTAAQDAAQNQWTHIGEALEAAEKYIADDLGSLTSMFPEGVSPTPDTQDVINDQQRLLDQIRLALGKSVKSVPKLIADHLTARLNDMRVRLAESVEERLAALRTERELRKTLASIEKTLEGPGSTEHVIAAALNEIRALKPSLWTDAAAFAEKAGTQTIAERDLSEVRKMLGWLNQAEAKAALYLKALEAMLANLPHRCDDCGSPAEYLTSIGYWCKKHDRDRGGPTLSAALHSPSLAMARAALEWEKPVSK